MTNIRIKLRLEQGLWYNFISYFSIEFVHFPHEIFKTKKYDGNVVDNFCDVDVVVRDPSHVPLQFRHPHPLLPLALGVCPDDEGHGGDTDHQQREEGQRLRRD